MGRTFKDSPNWQKQEKKKRKDMLTWRDSRHKEDKQSYVSSEFETQKRSRININQVRSNENE